MRTHRLLATSCIVGGSLLFGSLGASAGASTSTQQATAMQHVTIVGNNMLRFAPSTVHVHVGKVSITLKDSGAYPHNIVIPKLKETSKSVSGDPGGMRVTFTVDFRRAGRYPFHCQYHQSAGMVGTFVVSK